MVSRLALVGVVAAVLAGCGATTDPSPASPAPIGVSGSPQSPTAALSQPSPTAALIATPTVAASPTPVVSPSDASVFESDVYPYSLELPPGTLTRKWLSATRAWDGQARVGSDTPNVDITGTVDGGLLVWGLSWTGDAASFSDLISGHMARFHGCSVTSAPEPIEVAGVAGVGQRATCASDTRTMTAVLVRDGYGLVFRLRYDPDKGSVALPDLVRWLNGLSWMDR